jgi:hypothetical protein
MVRTRVTIYYLSARMATFVPEPPLIRKWRLWSVVVGYRHSRQFHYVYPSVATIWNPAVLQRARSLMLPGLPPIFDSVGGRTVYQSISVFL